MLHSLFLLTLAHLQKRAQKQMSVRACAFPVLRAARLEEGAYADKMITIKNLDFRLLHTYDKSLVIPGELHVIHCDSGREIIIAP